MSWCCVESGIEVSSSRIYKQNRGLWKRKDTTQWRKSLEYILYKTVIDLIVLYGATTLTLSIKLKDKVDTFDEFIRAIIRMSWKELVMKN